MTERQARRTLLTHPLTLMLLGGILLYLGWCFVQQVSINHQRREVLHQIEGDIVIAQDELAHKQGALEQAQAPQAAEEWARQHGWARPDEVLVVVVSPSSDAPPTAEGSAPQDAGPVSPRDSWWELFFGSR